LVWRYIDRNCFFVQSQFYVHGEAIVNVAVMIIPDKDGVGRKQTSIAVGGSGVDMGRMKDTEAILTGEEIDRTSIERAVDSIVKEVQVASDLNGSSDFKKRVLAATFERLVTSLRGSEKRP
ncbi:MAG: hypothetical protein M1587_10465, partial [Thaumarchaeota archaeon]|nr:hypothetical protein [Nitrososphaerota archaeon]